MQATVPQFGMSGMFFVTLSQLLPLSRLTWTRPSSLPAHRTPACFGDSARAKIVQYTSAPVLSPVIGPPENFCLDLSSRVRSGLTAFHVLPPSCVRNSTLAPWYTVLLSW